MNREERKKISDTAQENKNLKIEISKLKNELVCVRQERDGYLAQLLETRKSKTYRIAYRMTALPRMLRRKKLKKSRIYGTQAIYPYMISVVVAVYNTADFLDEMLDSLLNQKQDRLADYLRISPNSIYRDCAYENIYEMILVDDGSDDGSEAICDRYAAEYPWIKTLHKEHGGVSSARNAGIDLAKGKYITFPDSDDKLSINVFEDCFCFFEEHEKEISMATYPLTFFDGKQGDHWTAYRFEAGTRIIDMMEEWDKPQYFTAASFFKTEDLKSGIYFDENLINGEDTKLVHELMYRTIPKIGLISTCTYWYRRRSMGNQSAIQQSKQTEEYYVPYITGLLNGIKQSAEKTYGFFPKYVQYAIMGQLQWRIRSDPKGEEAISVIGEQQYAEYCGHIKELIRCMDIDVILSQKQLFQEHLFFLCNIKTNGEMERVCGNHNIQYYFEGRYCTEAALAYIKLHFLEIRNGVLTMEGECAGLEKEMLVWVQLGASKILCETLKNRDRNVYALGETVMYVNPFIVNILLPLKAERIELFFGVTMQGTDVIKRRIHLGKFMPINKCFSYSYYSKGQWSLRLDEYRIVIWNTTLASGAPEFENDFETQVLKSRLGKNKSMIDAVSLRREALSRLAWKKSNDRQIWLVSDRYSHADDNGEALFIYLMRHPRDDIQVYFVMDRESPDFARISAIGPVVAQGSREYYVLHLIADCIISSQADEYIIDPFWRQEAVHDIFKDFYCRNKFVFLQHGVIKDDLSAWLNRYNKNIDGFVCAAIPEAKSIREGNYWYDKQVWLTGLPRHDRLYHDEKKYILIMPTWRKWLMKDYNAQESDKDAVHVVDHIEHTEFFQFYSGLLNNKKLLDVCDEYGYKLCYMPHTNLRECMSKFCVDERVIRRDLDTPYRQAFAEANLLVTDYSSTPMDFAYLGKPVIYVQFDKEMFFSGEHTYTKGYFDYEEDGFGEVVYDLDAAIEMIISYIRNNCMLKEKYRERIYHFFAYNDQNNCERVYRKILGLTGNCTGSERK